MNSCKRPASLCAGDPAPSEQLCLSRRPYHPTIGERLKSSSSNKILRASLALDGFARRALPPVVLEPSRSSGASTFYAGSQRSNVVSSGSLPHSPTLRNRGVFALLGCRFVIKLGRGNGRADRRRDWRCVGLRRVARVLYWSSPRLIAPGLRTSGFLRRMKKSGR